MRWTYLQAIKTCRSRIEAWMISDNKHKETKEKRGEILLIGVISNALLLPHTRYDAAMRPFTSFLRISFFGRYLLDFPTCSLPLPLLPPLPYFSRGMSATWFVLLIQSFVIYISISHYHLVYIYIYIVT